ncbi:MAG: DUF839 domain-containing protein, partial [Proteobacteria bacterium]|nr:DUF839 domain-containing protein [Pseudomonadota bacterium]
MISLRFLRRAFLVVLLAGLIPGAAVAFPPLPHHTVYGLVRDEFGNPLTASGTELILDTLSGTSLSTSVVAGLEAGVNYRINVPVDAGLTDDLYRPTALRPTAPFRIRVKIAGRTYVPLEMKANMAQLGQPAQSSRVDLTLGEDTDGDGLPDAWERSVIAAGKLGVPISGLNPNDRLNGNPLSVLQAYIAGTYAWDPKDVGGGTVAGDKYLNEGKLYAARFDADGRGQWIELDIKDPRIANHAAFKFANQGEIYVHTRHAADAVGATKMDRPEWAAVNPKNGEVYITLTNNSAANRTPGRVDAANPRAYMDVDGKRGAGNPNGHIIRFREDGDQSTATGFRWDIFLFGAEEDAGDANLSALTARNSFSSPDGLWFSPTTGICWIQTDDGAMTDETHCMMLAALPGQVGDGGKVTVKNRMVVNGVEQTGTQDTFVGAALGEARLRRFL